MLTYQTFEPDYKVYRVIQNSTAPFPQHILALIHLKSIRDICEILTLYFEMF